LAARAIHFPKKKLSFFMAQIFSRNANVHARVTIFGAVVLICGAGWATSIIYWSPYTTYVGVPFDQPVSKILPTSMPAVRGFSE
jgi:hypothetical protein